MEEAKERVEEDKTGETSGCGNEEPQPQEGMVFESESAAKSFYDDYARRLGFQTRILSSRKSERDGSVISRGVGCRGGVGSSSSENRSTCPALVLLKKEKLGTWVFRRFVKNHNHPLLPHSRLSRRELDEKDIRIQELTAELRVKRRLSTAYKEQLVTFTKDVEDHNTHLSTKVQLVYDNLKKLEAEREQILHRKKPL